MLRIVTITLYVLSTLTQSDSQSVSKWTLLLSFDGFRADYFRRTAMPNFFEVAATGVYSFNVTSTFVTKTFPAHYSIATGLYQESHGIMANHFHDPVLGDFNRLNKKDVQNYKWWLGEPIWTTVRKYGWKAATYFWPGSEAVLTDPHQFVDEKFVKEYNKSVKFKLRVNQVLDWFQYDDVRFATLYYHEPDETGHRHGPDSDNIVDALKEVDGDLGYLLREMKTRNMYHSVNLVIVSDHGFTNMDKKDIVDLEDLPNFDRDHVAHYPDWGTSCQIVPKGNHLHEVYELLQNASQTRGFDVYKKEDIPIYWHYANTNRVSPLIVVAHEGYNVRPNNSSKYNLPDIGTHGYDNRLPNMRTIFMARGPYFKCSHFAGSVSTVNIYPMLCHILGVRAAPNNGSLAAMSELLVSSGNYSRCVYEPRATTGTGEELGFMIGLLVLATTFIVSVVTVVLCFCCCQRGFSNKSDFDHVSLNQQ